MRRGVVAAGIGLALAVGAAGSAHGAGEVSTTRLDGPAAGLPEACARERSASTVQLAARAGRVSAVYFEDGWNAVVGAVSDDDAPGGWRRGVVSDALACTGGPAIRAYGVNPTLAMGADGAALFGNSWAGGGGRLEPTLDQELYRYGVLSHRSEDGGATWSPGVDPAGHHAQDLSLTGHGDSGVGAAWVHFEQVPNHVTYAPAGTELRFAGSGDGGRTFGQPVTVHRAAPHVTLDTARVVTVAGGGLLALVARTPTVNLAAFLAGLPVTFEVVASRSSDGGRTWSDARRVADTTLLAVEDPENDCPPGDLSCHMASLPFDVATGADGAVAIAWATPRQDGTAAVRVVRSVDGGVTWRAPFDAVAVPGDVVQPAVAIGADGGLAAFWYDSAADRPGDATWDWTPRFAAQDDGWRPVGLTAPFDARPVPGYPTDGGEIGVYQDLVALPGGFGAAYTVGQGVAQDGLTDVLFTRLTR